MAKKRWTEQDYYSALAPSVKAEVDTTRVESSKQHGSGSCAHYMGAGGYGGHVFCDLSNGHTGNHSPGAPIHAEDNV